MSYQPWSAVYGEQKTASDWSQLGLNDAAMHDGTGIDNNVILFRHLELNLQDGWMDVSADTWVFASSSGVQAVVTVPSGATSRYAKGDKVRLVQGGVTKYFSIIGVTSTTLTLTGGIDYTLTNTAISSQCYSKGASPVGFPQWFNWTPTYVGFSTPPSNVWARFRIIGQECTINHYTNTLGTSNATSFTISLPVQAATAANAAWRQRIYTVDNGTAGTGADTATVLSGGTVATIAHNDNNAGWTASGLKSALFQLTYEI